MTLMRRIELSKDEREWLSKSTNQTEISTPHVLHKPGPKLSWLKFRASKERAAVDLPAMACY